MRRLLRRSTTTPYVTKRFTHRATSAKRARMTLDTGIAHRSSLTFVHPLLNCESASHSEGADWSSGATKARDGIKHAGGRNTGTRCLAAPSPILVKRELANRTGMRYVEKTPHKNAAEVFGTFVV